MTTIQNELSLAERAELRQLETTISRGWQTFIQVGEALSHIHKKRLYREDFATFEEYCQKVWNWSRNRAYQMMDAAKTASVLEEVGVTVAHEREARQLKPVAKAVAAAPAAQRKSVFEEAMQKAMTPTPAPAPVKVPSVKAAPPALEPASEPTSPVAPRAAVSDVALYLYRNATGTWRGFCYIGTTRYPLEDGLTLDEIQAWITRQLGALKQEATP